MRRETNILVVALLLVSTLMVLAEESDTQINVNNSPPELYNNIPDVSLLANQNVTDYFDLDDYFRDNNGDTFIVTHSNPTGITVTVDSENRVSFYPDNGFTGSQSMTFTVSDGQANVTSNTFTISVGLDSEPPQYGAIAKNRDTVYQNYFVIFTTVWTDNFQLKNYIFSINQAGTWVNFSKANLTGTSNSSSETVQISASPGTIVQWRFYAYDHLDNANVTPIQSFGVESFEISGTDFENFFGSGDSLGSGDVRSFRGESISDTGIETESFTVTPKQLKVSLRQGDTLSQILKITDLTGGTQGFTAEIKNIGSLGILSDNQFTVGPGGTYDLIIDFLIAKSTQPDEYFGTIEIGGSSDRVVVPVVIDIRPFESLIEVDVNVSEETKAVKQGRPVEATISVRNLLDARPDIARLIYAIKDFQGNIIVSEYENISLNFLFEEKRSLTVPDDLPSGEYIFYAAAFSQNRIDLDSDTFFVGRKFQVLLFLKKFLFFLLIALFLAVIVYLYLLYRHNRRKKRLLELYLLLNELRSLVKAGKTTDALVVYKRIKANYGQSIQKGFLENQEKLKVELDKFSRVLKETPLSSIKDPASLTPKPAVPVSAKPVASTPKSTTPVTQPTKPVPAKPVVPAPAKPTSSTEKPVTSVPAQPVAKPVVKSTTPSTPTKSNTAPATKTPTSSVPAKPAAQTVKSTPVSAKPVAKLVASTPKPSTSIAKPAPKPATSVPTKPPVQPKPGEKKE